MNTRRNFLGGLFGGLVSGGLLIKATDAETFAAPLTVEQPLIVQAPAPALPLPGQHLYNAKGEFVAVVTSFELGSMQLTAHLTGAMQWLPDEKRFRILGRG